jgi:hypothetical protein
MSYTDDDIEATLVYAEKITTPGDMARTLVKITRQLLAQRDEAWDEASDMRDEAYIDATAEKPISWQSMHEAECAARHAALADLAAATARIHALKEALKPFADMGANPDLNDGSWKDQSCQWIDCIEFDPCATVGDLRRARSTLSPQKEGE